MPFISPAEQEAFTFLKIENISNLKKKDLDTAYILLARQHSENHQNFLKSCKAYQATLNYLLLLDIKNPNIELRGSLSVEEALSNLYITISKIDEELDPDGISDTVFLNELREIFNEIKLSLRNYVLGNTNNTDVLLELIKNKANELNYKIDNLYHGFTPAFVGILGGSLVAITLGIFALLISLFPPVGIAIGTTALIGLIATPPVGGLLYGGLRFFCASTAHENRTEQKQKLKKIVLPIDELVTAIDTLQIKEQHTQALVI